MDSGWDFTSLISIHAPPRGATEAQDAKEEGRQISIHAPPRGATGLRWTVSAACLFQFTPLREGRQSVSLLSITIKTFQFTPLREGRPYRNYATQEVNLISIHAPPRGATPQEFSMRRAALISIHAPPRGATPTSRLRSIAAHFNSRPSARGDITADIDPDNNSVFQFTPLREGRPGGNGKENRDVDISIHAPPRGATHVRRVKPGGHPYFNSRPSARGDQHGQRLGLYCAHFNSRPSARGDLHEASLMLADSFISIHAPPRGATYYNGFIWCESRISIHAPPRGATQAAHAVYLPKKDFNSRPSARGDFRQPLRDGKPNISIHAPPRGATSTGMSCRPAHNFNSRPSARGDGIAESEPRRLAISIHAPPRGATGPFKIFLIFFSISIHAPPRGATSAGGLPAAPAVYFNSRPSARGDAMRGDSGTSDDISIHAPPRGATFPPLVRR